MITWAALIFGLVALLLGRWLRTGPSPGSRAGGVPTWDCGYAAGTARMQYTASSFADGLVGGLRWLLGPVVHQPRLAAWFPRASRYASPVPDPVLDRAAGPALGLAAKGASLLRVAQGGSLHVYLLYVLLTLLALLVWMMV